MTDDLTERVARAKLAMQLVALTRAEALEEAAKVAENHDDWNPFPTRQRAIAAAIRALIKKE